MYDIIIVGAGPAGLTAAIYARRAAKSVLVLEGGAYGGQIINTPDIENYPVAAHISGFEFATKVYNQAKELGAEFRFEQVLAVEDCGEHKEAVTRKNRYQGRAVILATGSKNRPLGTDNEAKLVGRGISYCATCDGGFFRGKEVAVVGGGNTALEDALYLADLAQTVYLIHRRDTFRGETATVEKLRGRENVRFVYNSVVTALRGDTRLEGIEVTDTDGNRSQLSVTGLFVAIGRLPANQSYADLVTLDSAGYVQAGEDCRTNVPGVFVAGDNRSKQVRQLVTAASDGAIAATEAVKYLA